MKYSHIKGFVGLPAIDGSLNMYWFGKYLGSRLAQTRVGPAIGSTFRPEQLTSDGCPPSRSRAARKLVKTHL
jgi:hypothetical protein